MTLYEEYSEIDSKKGCIHPPLSYPLTPIHIRLKLRCTIKKENGVSK